MLDISIGGCKKRLISHIPDIVISGVLATFLQISLNYKRGGTLYQGKLLDNVEMLLLWWGLVLISINVIDAVLVFISKREFLCSDRILRFGKGKIFAFNLLLVFLLWLPYLIITYPGSAWYDCSSSIKQMYGVVPLSNWNPIIQTIFIGGSIRLGEFFFNENFGLFLYNVIQMLFASGVVSYGLTYSLYNGNKKIGINKLIILCIYAMLPVYPFYVTSAGKDTNWSCCILLMVILLWQIERNGKWMKKKHSMVLYVATFLGICLLRNTGVFVAIPCAMVATIYSSKAYKKLLAISSACCVIGFILWTYIFLPTIGVSLAGMSRDSWNIQFQQMARYVKFYPNEVTEENIETINKMLSFEELSTKYNPNIVDTVTDVYYGDEIEKDDLVEFNKLYWSWFKNHPGCYLDAFVAKCIGYFTPISYHSVKPFTIIGVSDVNSSVKALLPEFNLYSVNDLSSYNNFANWLQKTSGVNLFTHCGFWTWLIFYTLFAAIKRNKKIIPMILPFMVVIIGLTIVPTNNYFRYSLSLVFVVPLLIDIVYSFEEGKGNG